MKKTGLIFVVMTIALLLFSTCDEGMFGSLEKLEEQAIEENSPSAGVTKYTVTFDMNKGAGTAPAAQTVEAGTEITLPSGSGFARSGFGFDGWNTEIDGSGDDLSAGSAYTVNGNVTLYAKWSTSYTVEFNLNNGTGTTPTAQTVSPGANIELPDGTGFSRTGFTFSGWNTNPNGMETDHLAGPYTVNASVTLYAKWTCTITFSINNGSGTVPSAQTGIAGTEITLPDNSEFSRTGFSFDGWNTNTSGTGDNYPIGEPYTMNGSKTLYARWIADQPGATYYLVKFELNGVVDLSGDYGDFQCLAGTQINRPADPEKTNFTFGAWFNNPEFTGAAYNFSSPVTGPLTLYVKWRSTVKFETNGGSPVPDQLVDIGATVASVTDPGKEHYTFEGWYSDSGLTPASKWNFASSTAESNMTLYANWTPVQYTVTYNINGGSGTTPDAKTADYDSSITLDNGSGLTKRGCSFGGWNANPSGIGTSYTSPYTVTGNVTLYAKWDAITVPPGSTLNDKLDWLEENAISDVDYTLEANASEPPISPRTLSYGSYTNISVKLVGNTSTSTLSLPGNGSMFTVPSGITLVLENLTLQGHGSNNASLVAVSSGGKLTMNNGSVITGNTRTTGNGGGVYIASGTLTMNTGSKISENILSNSSGYGGGVYAVSGSTIILNGGEISGNTSTAAGGGMYVNGGTITMSGGKIIDNTASRGGGVFTTATFTMSGSTALISENKTNASATTYGGGGVYIETGGNFTMSSGTISGNTSVTYGGAVFVHGGTFTMSDGAKISGNSATNYGGGVYVLDSDSDSVFTMNGGTIGGTTTADVNTANSGGGVFVSGAGAEFKMSGGTISGNKSTATTGTYGGGGVFVALGGKFTLSDTAKISGNITSRLGGGVHVTSTGSKFIMEGGTISGNEAIDSSGGGVMVTGGADFTMSGGAIGGSTIGSANTGSLGGGVYISGSNTDDTTISKFTMSGGKITGNNSTSTGTSAGGGGVYISSGGKFTIQNDAIISGNTAVLNGGGVFVYASSSTAFGTFDMEGGTIGGTTPAEANTAQSGGGVYMNGSNAVFNMSGGTISGNEATTTSVSSGYGGGGVLSAGTFTMSGTAVISGNTANQGGGVLSNRIFNMSGSAKITGANTATTGAGVYVNTGTFTMSVNAVISGNIAAANGGGVYVYSDSSTSFGTFDMIGGTIGGTTPAEANTALSGGGVCVDGYYAVFKMSGNAKITGNTATSTGMGGGGVSVNRGTFNMSENTAISGNIAAANGGGVAISSNCTFNMSGGTISGNTANRGTTGGDGGGVWAYGNFNMSGTAVISGNTAATYGGGVYLYAPNATLNKTGGTIYGYTAGITNSNMSMNNTSGNAVYLTTTPAKYRNDNVADNIGWDKTTATTTGTWQP